MDDVKAVVREYVLRECLPGEDPSALTDSTPLLTGGILDSIATLRLIAFLEETFGVSFEAYEVDPDHFDTVERIARLVQARRKARPS